MRKKKPTISKHLPCPKCEYDLFGLGQESQYQFGFVERCRTVQCPECGEDVEVSAALGQLRAKRVKATFLLLTLCIVPFVPLLCFGVAFLYDGRPWQAAALIVFGPLWLAGLWIYGQKRKQVDYAWQVLLMFHGCFVTGIGGVAVLAFAIFHFVSRSPLLEGLVVLGAVSLVFAWKLFWEACELIEDGHDLHLHRMAKGPSS